MKKIKDYFDDEAEVHDELFIQKMGLGEFYDEVEQALNACIHRDKILVLGCVEWISLDLVKGRPLHFKPGEGTAYSNTNYHFLSDIIERIMNMSFNEYLITNIFEVLGMCNSHANGFKADAKGYVKDEYGNILDCGRHGMLSGDSGVASNMKDMEFWCSAILNRRLLRQESWNQCFYIINNRFGMGFQKFNHWIGHNGGMPGIYTRERLHLPSSTAIIVLSNTINPHHDILNEIMEWIEIGDNAY